VADVQTEVDALPLSLAAPYLAQSLEPTLDGKLSGQIDIAWNQPNLKFKARRLAADGLALTQTKTALASVGRFELVDAEVDMTKHTLNIASFTATNPKVRVERDSEKRWMFERWLSTPAGERRRGRGQGGGAQARRRRIGQGRRQHQALGADHRHHGGRQRQPLLFGQGRRDCRWRSRSRPSS
jgi:hypothetical protein